MLVHVFDTVTTLYPEESHLFMRRAGGEHYVGSWKEGRHWVVEQCKEDEAPQQVRWPSGMLYQKLGDVHSARALPILWRLCKYYDTSKDELNEAVREYTSTLLGVQLERSPFVFMADLRQLHCCCDVPTKSLSKTNKKKVQFSIDNESLNVILLPHRGVVKTLLRRLEEVAL